jgi:hypothetical protein
MPEEPTLPAHALVRDDVLIRLQRRIGLVPPGQLGVARRAVFWAAVTWLPIAVWAVAGGHATSPDGESMLQHYGVTVRMLVAVPLMIVAEGVLIRSIVTLTPRFVESGLLDPAAPAVRRTVAGMARLRDAAHPWALAAGVALAVFATLLETAGASALPHGLAWAGVDGRATFGLAWLQWFARPVFFALTTVWLWRALLLGIALRRLSACGLRLVPTHPDRAGGLGFMSRLTAAFGVVAFALSATAAAGWSHDVLHHGQSVRALYLPMAATVVLLTAAFLAPLLMLAGPMARAKLRARFAYGALVARHGDALHRRWIRGEAVEDPVLDAPEIGAAADAAALFEAVGRMRPVPFDATAVAWVAVPAAAPMVALVAAEVPLIRLLGQVLAALL